MELQTVKEIANIWRIGETKVWSLIQHGKLKRYFKGNTVAVSKSEFMAYIDQNTDLLREWQTMNAA